MCLLEYEQERPVAAVISLNAINPSHIFLNFHHVLPSSIDPTRLLPGRSPPSDMATLEPTNESTAEGLTVTIAEEATFVLLSFMRKFDHHQV